MNVSAVECPICYEEITLETGIVNMACKHSFHFRCITGWFFAQSNKDQTESCPCCRREMSEKEGLPVITKSDSESEQESESESESEHESEDESEAGVDEAEQSDSAGDNESNPDLSETEKLLIQMKETSSFLNLEKQVIECSINYLHVLIDTGEIIPGAYELKNRLEGELYLPLHIRRKIINNISSANDISNTEILNINLSSLENVVCQIKKFDEIISSCELIISDIPKLSLSVTVNNSNLERVVETSLAPPVIPNKIIFNPEDE